MRVAKKLSNKRSFNFSGHETFPFRYAWLKKGVDAVSRDGSFFSNERAMVELGVGKNMVQSIRHWCLATKMLAEESSQLIPTNLGRSILLDGGFDPYLEDTATLWLIHWNLASNTNLATTWFSVFSHWHSIEFTKDQLIFWVKTLVEETGRKRISENTIRRDVDCFVRTYVHSRHTKAAVQEDTLDCPLVDLRLIVELHESKSYQFQRGPQASLPDEIFVLALIDYWMSSPSRMNTNTLAFERIAYDPGSPGRIFKIDEDSLASRLERIEKVTKGALRYGETAGLKQVYRDLQNHIEPLELLEIYYGTYSLK